MAKRLPWDYVGGSGGGVAICLECNEQIHAGFGHKPSCSHYQAPARVVTEPFVPSRAHASRRAAQERDVR